VRAGDFVGAPAGGQAHQLINTGKSELRYLGISSLSPAEIVEYPDSKKIGVFAGVTGGDFRKHSYRGMGRLAAVDYFDGED
jgi:uncharacterized cupin superfamily protein